MPPSKNDVDRMRSIGARLLACGVEVLWVPGWDKAGAAWTRTPIGIVDHHDASTRKSGEWGALGVIRSGRPDVAGPLSQFQIGRALDGVPRVAIVAAGRANHAGKGGPRSPIPRDSANGWLLGAEAANDGVSEGYTAAALRAHHYLFRACMDVCGFGAAGVIGHKEWAPGRKSDPRYDMASMRRTVAGVDTGSAGVPPGGRPVVREGSSGELVKSVQVFLKRVFPTYAGGLVTDGVFGPATRAVVTEYQRRSRLTADGVIGPATWAALERSGFR